MITATGTARTYVAIAGLLLLGLLFASLGTWQLHRAEASRATRAQFAGGAADSALAELPLELDDAARFRRAEVRGEYVGRPQFLLDNMLHDGVAGYQVLTALRIPGRRERVLVNRGWVPAGGDRRALPDIAVGSETRLVAGRLEHLPRPGMRLGANVSGDAVADAVVVLQYPVAAELEQRLGEPVYDYELLLDAAAADGYVREWQAPGLDPERHLAYAGQWWALAVGAVAAAMVMAYRTIRGSPQRGALRRKP
ncbi:MAG TPA: SURF1 family protein [Gammaproteobacteria bacterium]|nr:SURF1 family protein [Gammaproteobacteria bacterium]